MGAYFTTLEQAEKHILGAPLGSVSPPLLRAPRYPCPRCGPRWRCTMALLRSPYAGLVIDLCITRSACGSAVYTPSQRHDHITHKEYRDDI